MTTVAVVGLGYVGLPLAIEFGKHFDTIGFDVSKEKVARLQQHNDVTGEVERGDFDLAKKLTITADPKEIGKAEMVVVAVPTPIDEACLPDFTPLVSASRIVGANMKRGATVIYESTVYPGATEEVCIPVLEELSGMKWKTDFNVGYSPERINPGDKQHRLPSIVKVVSGDTPETLEAVAKLYEQVITAGVHRASSIKVAEAAKVIENTQRDLNIALMNELAIVFNRLNIDTLEVLKAAGSKWNFLPFRPGLVGGHCIGVDPYYLTHKAQTVGYHPEVILAGRRINDGMGGYIAEQTVKMLARQGLAAAGQTVVVLGLTFKEDVPDLRNSKVIDVVRELEAFGVNVLIHDPIADKEEARHEYGVELVDWDKLPKASALVAAVSHQEYQKQGLDKLLEKLVDNGVFVDVKSAWDPEAITKAGRAVWRL